MGAKNANSDPDALIARIAARQHGVISLTQLEHAGIHRRGVARRVQSKRLYRIHRGIYAVGHTGLTQEGRWKAAVMALGEGAVLSHRSAGALWRIMSPASLIDVTVPARAGRERRDGIRIHRSSTLVPTHCTLRANIPVTTPARTLADLRRMLPPSEFAGVLREAEFKRLPIPHQFKPDGTRTELEGRFLALCRRHRLPRPEVNIRIGPDKVDFLWHEQRLIVEVDGWEGHRIRSAFEEDRARDARLKVLGFTVVRFTWRQLADDPPFAAETVRMLLTAAES